MKIKVNMQIREEFLPNRRCRKERYRYVKKEYEGEIIEPEEKDFPVAVAVEDYQGVVELRHYAGKLWKAIKACDMVCKAEGWATAEMVLRRISNDDYSYFDNRNEFTDGVSIVTGNDSKSVKELLETRCRGYILFDGKYWKECGEPMYVVMTFGLGHNHGGTSLMIDYWYNSNISHHNYFNALHRKEAIEAAKKTAINRGDTESVDRIGKSYNIIVYDKSCIHRCPEKECGDGDPFLNTLNALTDSADSAAEAGLLAVAFTLGEISKEG